jgi:hypothetical protein
MAAIRRLAVGSGTSTHDGTDMFAEVKAEANENVQAERSAAIVQAEQARQTMLSG